MQTQIDHRPAASAMRLNPTVFYSSATVIGLAGLLMALFPAAGERWLRAAQEWVAQAFGWYYMLLVVAVLVFVVWLAFSRHGRVRLGRDDEQPSMGYVSWVSMLFSAGIGIALLYYGAYEPLDHFLSPPRGEGGSAEAAREAMALTFLHWGLHGWALYALVGVTLAYFAFRLGLPLALRSALHPLFGERIHGRIGHAVDAFGILATLISMATNLGIGALVLRSGLVHLLDIPSTDSVLMIIVGVMMVVATLATISGVQRGITWLSNLNVRLLCLLLLFVLAAGPTLHLFDGLVQNVGDYLAGFVRKSFDLYINEPEGRQWSAGWTLFYWAWWIAWAPFVGMFIARISRGRTIREMVLGVMLIPLGFTLAWLSIFGNTAIDLVLNQGQAMLGAAAQAEPAMALFELLEYLPFPTHVAAITVVIGFVLFLTPVDSGTLMIANLSTSGGAGEDDAPIWLRVFWAVATTVLTAGLLLAGSFGAMQMAVVLCGLPFAVILPFYMWGLMRSLREERTSDRDGSGISAGSDV